MAIFSRKPKPAPSVPTTMAAARPSSPAAGGASEQRIMEIGRDMLDRARSHKTGLLSAKF